MMYGTVYMYTWYYHNTLHVLYRYQGYISAALVLGGVDVTGPHLHCIYPHGSSDQLPYVTMGSGSLAAMSVFESRFKPNMDVSSTPILTNNGTVATAAANITQ